ncbi:MAG: hypothetical protein B6244_12685 [Candidatus Cloacimonetes bacterium 4572_55]|nr:MAG: hypothetical protein B6244_12685 [Candidatus Cloacimonetes bacterium 4572_55]
MKRVVFFAIFLFFVPIFISSLWASALPTAEWISLRAEFEQQSAPQMTVFGYDDSQTTIDFELPGLTSSLMIESQGDFHALSAPLTGFTNEIGKPDLPVFSKFVVIPATGGATAEIIYTETEVFQDVRIFPTQEPVPEGETRTDFIMDHEFYQTHNQLYPQEIVKTGEPVVMRDFRLAQIVVQPVQYNPATKELVVHHHIQIRVSYEGSNPAPRRGIISAAWDPVYRATICNYDQIREGRDLTYGSYLILTPNNQSVLPYLELFAEWKHRSGWDTRIVQLSEIGSNPSSYQIKSYIQDAYDNWDVPPEYVLLVGDEDSSPVGQMPDYSYGGYTSDHQYSTVDGNDYLADIFVGRASVDNINELGAYMAKTLTYEQTPFMEDGGAWFKRATMVACAGCGGPQVVTPVLTCNWVREKLLRHRYTQVDTFYDGWQGGYPSASQISASISDGRGIVNYRGWAGPSGWYNPSYNLSNIYGLNNGWQTGIMTSIVCGTGQFGSYEDPCFGEAWIRAGSSTQPKGGIIFGGASDTNTHTRWNNPITIGFYYGLFEEGMTTFGQCFVRGKLNQFFGFPNDNQPGGTIQQYHNTYNVLGDPGVSIFTEIPTTFDAEYDAQINYGQNSFSVSVASQGAPVQEAWVVLWKESGGVDDVFEQVMTDENGQATLMISPQSAGTMKLTIHKHNFIPLQDDIQISQGDYVVGVTDWTADGDGVINPGETVEMTVTAKNFGSTSLSNVTATVNSMTEWAEITQIDLTFGNIETNQTAQASFSFSVPAHAMNRDKIQFDFIFSDDQSRQWEGAILENVNAFHLSVKRIVSSNIDPGETGDLIVELQNNGSVSGQSLSMELESTSSLVFVQDGTSSFGTIQPGGTQTNSENPFSISVSPEVLQGMQFNMKFTATDGSGYSHEFYYPIQFGDMEDQNAIVGPDAYGYYAYDNADSDPVGTTYEWVEIATQEGGPGTVILGLGDDDTRSVNLPFDFQYYGETFSQVSICSNGWFAFGSTGWTNFRNWQIPNGIGPDAQVMVFWDDLGVSGGNRAVYTWYDEENNRFIIEWFNASCEWGGSGSNTFQAILLDPEHYLTPTEDGEILMQYETATNNDTGNNYATVGIESIDQSHGVQYNYANSPAPGGMSITSGLALRFTTTEPINAVSSISGSITLDGSNDPATMTHLRLWQNLNNERILKGEAPVSEDGSFLFENVYSILGAGEYYISVLLSDLYAPTLEWYEDSPSYESATAIEINNGDDVTGIEISVSIPELPDISGSVENESTGESIENAFVTVWRNSNTGNPIYLESATTDENGSYSFNNGYMDHLGANRYYVSVRLSGDTNEAEWYQDAVQFIDAEPVDIDYDQPMSNIDFSLILGEAAGIRGVAYDEENNPLPDYRVVAWQDDNGDPEFVAFAVSGENGEYQIGGSGWNYLTAGTYYVSLALADQGQYPAGWHGGATYETATPVIVSDGSVTENIDVTMVMPTMGTISGTVLFDDGDPAEDAEVLVMIQGNSAYCSRAVADENGQYTISAPPASDAIVYVAHPYYGGIVEYYADADTPDQAEPVTVSAGQTTTVDFEIPELNQNGLVSGSISCVGGANNIGMVYGFHVNDRDKPVKSFFIGSGTAINYSKTFMPGDYMLMAVGSDVDGTKVLHYFDDTHNPVATTPVHVTPNGYLENRNFRLDFSSRIAISGRVTNSDGPVETARVCAVSYQDGVEEWKVGSYTDADGNYTLNVPAGSYHVMALGQDGVPMFYGNEVNWINAPIVNGGASNIDITLPITRDLHGTSVSGTITCNENPVPYVRVYAVDDFGPAGYGVTDEAGEFTIYGLQPEVRYMIQANRVGYFHSLYLTPITLDPFESRTGVDMELIPYDIVSIEVPEDGVVQENDYALFQNFPNPFNPLTTIRFQLPQADHAVVEIYNILGQEVRKLADKSYSNGIHQVIWDGKNDSGIAVGSGVYYYRIITQSGFEETKRMALLK